MRYALAACAFFCLGGTALAERIPDMSLSPEETLRQPDIVHDNSEKYLGGSTDTDNRYDPRQSDYYHQQSAGRGKLFMDQYCNPAFKPIVNPARHGIIACAESVRKEACNGFSLLPRDAKEPIDHTVECVYASAQSGAESYYDMQCRDAYVQQIWLLKKYWGDEKTTYTILYLPDMVADSSSFCQEGRR